MVSPSHRYVVLAVGLIVGAAFLGRCGRIGSADRPLLGRTAPAWSLVNVDGKRLQSTDFLGKVVVIDFWATWCPPCRMEIPGYVALQRKYGDQGLVIVGISLDQAGVAAVKTFLNQNGVDYPVVMGDAAVVKAFGGIEGIPTTFVIDRTGKVAFSKVGYMAHEAFEAKVQPLL
jgi:thiol-disulfide isomerase/thioredoxin